jgi:hypothetical protein
MNKSMMFSAATATLACAAGCANQSDMRMTEGQPPEYATGFRSGCDSGYAAAGHPYYRPSKDVQRMETDKTYATGWNDGFVQCKGSYEAIGRAMPR